MDVRCKVMPMAPKIHSSALHTVKHCRKYSLYNSKIYEISMQPRDFLRFRKQFSYLQKPFGEKKKEFRNHRERNVSKVYGYMLVKYKGDFEGRTHLYRRDVSINFRNLLIFEVSDS